MWRRPDSCSFLLLRAREDGISSLLALLSLCTLPACKRTKNPTLRPGMTSPAGGITPDSSSRGCQPGPEYRHRAASRPDNCQKLTKR